MVPCPPNASETHAVARVLRLVSGSQVPWSDPPEEGAELLLSLPLHEIPGSDDGGIASMAAAAALAACQAQAMGLESDQIDGGSRRSGLQAGTGHRNGRFELLIEKPWTVVLGWADGPEAVASRADDAQARKAMQTGGRRLLLSAPDTRPDGDLRLPPRRAGPHAAAGGWRSRG